MGYELKQSDILDLAHTLDGRTRQKGDELFFQYCPYCHGGQSRDKNTFSVNLQTGTFHCFRSSCGRSGHFVELARDFGYQLDFGENWREKKFKRLPQKEITVRDPAVEWLKTRGISEEITRLYHITTRKKDKSVLVFPFYNENHVLEFVKYRNTDPQRIKDHGKEFCEKDTKPILFGMDHCQGFERLVITEGQIDSLTLAECGVRNAVSVPTGCKGFTFLNYIWDWIIKFSEVVVFGDHENGRITLLDELQRKLPVKVKAVREEDYLGEKDANDIYQKYGRQAVVTAVENAQVVPVKCVKRLSDVKSVDLSALPKIRTGLQELDQIIGGFYFGQVILLTGKRGEGKSTLLSQLDLEAIDQGYATLIYSGELADYHVKNWMDLQAAGPDNIQVNYDENNQPVSSIPADMLHKINEWYTDLAYIYDNHILHDDSSELESLLDTMEASIQRYDIKLICIDNLMTAMDAMPGEDFYQAQSNFVKQLKKLAVKYDVVVILVAHPRKTKDAIGNDDVSGSSDITNRVDVVLSYSRDENNSGWDGTLSVLKNRLTGKLTPKGQEIKLLYSGKSKRIRPASSDKGKVYGWEINERRQLMNLEHMESFYMEEWEDLTDEL